MNTKMYVGNLSFDTTEADLRDLFGSHGAVTDVHLPTDRDSGRPRGFAFVTMENSSEAKSAIQSLDGKPFLGRAVSVNEARPREERGGAGAYNSGNNAQQKRHY